VRSAAVRSLAEAKSLLILDLMLSRDETTLSTSDFDLSVHCSLPRVNVWWAWPWAVRWSSNSDWTLWRPCSSRCSCRWDAELMRAPT
jgi:hypothetical protein